MKKGNVGLGENVGQGGVGGGHFSVPRTTPAGQEGRAGGDGAVPAFDDNIPGDKIDHSAGTFSGSEQKAPAIPGRGRADT